MLKKRRHEHRAYKIHCYKYKSGTEEESLQPASYTMAYVGIFMAAFTFLLLPKIWQVLKISLWRPYALSRSFRKQGVKGPSYSLFSGSLHEMKRLKMDAAQIVMDTTSNDITPRVLPQYHKWCPLYGEFLSYSYACFGFGVGRG